MALKKLTHLGLEIILMGSRWSWSTLTVWKPKLNYQNGPGSINIYIYIYDRKKNWIFKENCIIICWLLCEQVIRQSNPTKSVHIFLLWLREKRKFQRFSFSSFFLRKQSIRIERLAPDQTKVEGPNFCWNRGRNQKQRELTKLYEVINQAHSKNKKEKKKELLAKVGL